MHFMFYSYITRNSSKSKKDEIESSGAWWLTSEIFNNVILDLPEFRELLGGYFEEPHPGHQEYIEPAKKLYQESANLDEFIPAEVYEKSEMTALVHASLSGGNILLIDLKDIILPVYIRDNKWTKNLYRNDLIKFKYIVRSNPKRPTHLELNVDDPEPLVVLNKLVEQHGQRRTIEGSLVRFAKSPQVKFDIYAIETTDQLGNRVNYTLINFENSELFASIREKAGRVWDRYKATAVDGRNKMVNRKIHVSATGLINVVATDQANPQVVLDSVDNLKFSREICAYEEIL
jgi:hypothetical protein